MLLQLENSTTEKLLGLLVFVERYSHLYNFDAVNFYTNNVWAYHSCIPLSWKTHLASYSIDELLHMANSTCSTSTDGNNDKQVHELVPQSLKEFIRDSRMLPIDRTADQEKYKLLKQAGEVGKCF